MKKLLAVFAVCALLVLVAAGCSAGVRSEQSADGVASDNYYNVGTAELEYEAAKGESGAAPRTTANVADTRKLIKTVSLTVETKAYDAYLGGVRAAVTAAGGYIEKSYEYLKSYSDSGNRNSSIVARIPADRLDDFLADAGKNGKIINQNEQISDVTLNYVDIESRLKALKTERDSLTKLLAEAESLDGIIAIQTRLTEVNYQIENYESQLRMLDNQISYSTVSMEIYEVERVSAANESLAAQIKTRLLNNLSSIREDAKSFAVSFIGGLPYIVIWCAAAVVLILISRAAVRRRRKKKALAKNINESVK